MTFVAHWDVRERREGGITDEFFFFELKTKMSAEHSIAKWIWLTFSLKSLSLEYVYINVITSKLNSGITGIYDFSLNTTETDSLSLQVSPPPNPHTQHSHGTTGTLRIYHPQCLLLHGTYWNLTFIEGNRSAYLCPPPPPIRLGMPRWTYMQNNYVLKNRLSSFPFTCPICWQNMTILQSCTIITGDREIKVQTGSRGMHWVTYPTPISKYRQSGIRLHTRK